MLNDMTCLLDAAAEVGLEVFACETFLRSTKGEREILQTVDYVHSIGVHSIPTLVIDGGRDFISGAAEVDTVVATLRSVVLDRNRESYAPPIPLFPFQDRLRFPLDGL